MQRTYFIKKHIYGISAVLLTAAIILCMVAQYFCDCSKVRSEVLRLHVIANSDSAEDQSIKLEVRDRILKAGGSIFDGTVTVQDATKKITPALLTLQNEANAILFEKGYNYSAKAELINEYFSTRTYNDITLPAGNYTALKITLGSGEGKNWWCVMFPPLCLPACTDEYNSDSACNVFFDEAKNVVKAESGYKVRFKIVELIQQFIEDLKNGSD